MRQPPAELLESLNKHDPGVQTVALGLRQVVVEEMAPCHEYIFTMGPRVVLLYGPTSRAIEDCVCMIHVYRSHVNLQFTDGVELTDTCGALEGTGARMRHIKVRALSDLDRPAIRAYLREARKNAGMVAPRGRTANEVITKVKTTPSRKTRQTTW
jgi:hypothetical protein